MRFMGDACAENICTPPAMYRVLRPALRTTRRQLVQCMMLLGCMHADWNSQTSLLHLCPAPHW